MKFKILNLKYLMLFGILILGFVISGQTVFGQAASDGATQLRDSVKQKVNEEISQIKLAVSKKAFLGVITGKSEASLTLTAWTKDTRTVLVGTDAAIKLQNGKDGTPADLKTNDYILVMGDADGQNTLTAKRLLVIAGPKDNRREALFGTVSKKTTSTLTLTTPKNENIDIKLSSVVVYTGKTKAADVKVDSKVLVLTQHSATSYSALNIYLYPTP